MQTISLRFEEGFIHDMEKIMKSHRYATKTEFIRQAVREKMNELEQQKTLARMKKAYGAGKGRKISDKQLHQAGEQVIQELADKLGVSSK